MLYAHEVSGSIDANGIVWPSKIASLSHLRQRVMVDGEAHPERRTRRRSRVEDRCFRLFS
jgi:hypothetical protein